MSILFLVPGLGLEPRWVAPLVFETSASTNSAIRACGAKVGLFSASCKYILSYSQKFYRQAGFATLTQLRW